MKILGPWRGTSALLRNLLLTKLTTVPTPAPKRRDAPVLPANLETFVKAIELLAEQRSCEVGLIGLGRGDSSFGPHTLASFPTHDPRKGKRIAWAWINSSSARMRISIFDNASKTSTSFSCGRALGRNFLHSFSKMALYNRDSSGMLGLCT